MQSSQYASIRKLCTIKMLGILFVIVIRKVSIDALDPSMLYSVHTFYTVKKIIIKEHKKKTRH